MIRFNNDYNHAAHESIYEAMKADQANNYPGYGTDEWCTKAAEEIKKLIGREDPAIYFSREQHRRILWCVPQH